MNREVLINSLEEFMSETDARLTALEAAKPQAPAASCDEMLDTLLLSNADKRAAIANLTAQCNTLAAQVDDLRNINAGLRKHNASQQDLLVSGRLRSLRRIEALLAVEWVTGECPWCGNSHREGHEEDCPRLAAVPADRTGGPVVDDEKAAARPAAEHRR